MTRIDDLFKVWLFILCFITESDLSRNRSCPVARKESSNQAEIPVSPSRATMYEEGETKEYTDEVYKAAKLGANGDVKSNGRATVEDDVDDEEAGPALPPADEDEGPEDDEDGRFFGGGITRDTADVLDFIDGREQEEIAVGYSCNPC